MVGPLSLSPSDGGVSHPLCAAFILGDDNVRVDPDAAGGDLNGHMASGQVRQRTWHAFSTKRSSMTVWSPSSMVGAPETRVPNL
jgi:hypothetical protein